MIEVKQASLADVVIVSSILKEAASWLRTTGRPMWRDDELNPDRIHQDVQNGLFYLALYDEAAEPSNSSSRTLVSGPIFPVTMPPTCIGSL
jgi:hypothetical protein